MDSIQIIELVAATLGLLYLWLQQRASIWLWIVGIILPLFYIYISWKSQVYGNMFVNGYYIIASVWGGYEWLRHRHSEETMTEVTISHLPENLLLRTFNIVLLLWLILWPVYDKFMSSPFPLWDGLATAVSFVGMWLLGKKYIETWYCWILSNALFCTLYFIQGFVITGCFFIVYTIMSVVGYFEWRKMLLNDGDNDRS